MTIAVAAWLASVLLALAVQARETAPPQPVLRRDRTSQPGASAESATRPLPQDSAATTAPTIADLRASAWGMLAGGASSDKARTRSDALSAMTLLSSDPVSIAILEDALGDKEENIRVLAATSLGEIKARSAIPQLREALEDPSPQVSFAAAQALWQMDDHSGRSVLFEVLEGEKKTTPGLIKGHVNQAKEQLRDPKQLALIGVREASGAFLGPGSMGITLLEEYESAKSRGIPVEALCARLLESDDTEDTVDELRDALDDKSVAVRTAAARSLAQMDRREMIPALAAMMKGDKTQAGRFVAAAAAVRLIEAEVKADPAALAKPAPAEAESAKP